MKITFIGTGAADWKVDFRGTEGYRRFSTLLIDNRILIDPGPHIFSYEEDMKQPEVFAGVEHILLTHSHDDHLDQKNLQELCHRRKRSFWCEKHAEEAVRDIKDLDILELPLFTPVSVDDYVVTALPANHWTWIAEEQALHLIIEKDDVRIFYGCDGAWFPRNTWYYLRDLQFDLMILDGTLGDDYGDHRIFDHNNLRMVEIMSETIRKTGMIKPDGKIMISHLARKVHGTQSQVEERLKDARIGVAYDGCVVKAGK